MLKYCIALSSLMILLLSANSQDTIIKTYGDKIECKVMEITDMLVKCKQFNSSDETIYTIPLRDVYMIKYEDGREEYIRYQDPNIQSFSIEAVTKKGSHIWLGDRKLKPDEVKALFGSCPEALAKYNKGKAIEVAGVIFAIPFGAAVGWGLVNAISGEEISSTVIIVGGVGLLGTLIFGVASSNSIKESVRLFNASLKNHASLKLNAGFTQNGIGLRLTF